MGQKLLAEVIDYAKKHGALPARPQEEQYATKAPALAS
jgi:methionyl-tRNA formyltransferase